MGHVIAVSGKGGVGKTTLCGLLIQYLCESGKRPVLAVDADANANLNNIFLLVVARKLPRSFLSMIMKYLLWITALRIIPVR